MSGKIFNTRVKNKRDSVSNWTDKNPILLDGEVVVVDSTDGKSRFKIGDGAKHYSDSACICTAIAKGGIEYADATTPTFAGKDAMFTAIVKEGYTFKGWYSDEGCTTFISSNNPLSITTPSVNKDSADPQDGEATTSELTLYARARSTTGRSDMLYFKVNGSYKSAIRVYKKVSGTWVEQADLPAIFSGEPSGGASNYVYGGSV